MIVSAVAAAIVLSAAVAFALFGAFAGTAYVAVDYYYCCSLDSCECSACKVAVADNPEQKKLNKIVIH